MVFQIEQLKFLLFLNFLHEDLNDGFCLLIDLMIFYHLFKNILLVSVYLNEEF